MGVCELVEHVFRYDVFRGELLFAFVFMASSVAVDAHFLVVGVCGADRLSRVSLLGAKRRVV